MKCYIASASEIKKLAVINILEKLEFKKLFLDCEIISHEINALVSITPYEEETYQGARNRAHAIFNQFQSEGDLFIGLESGLVKRHGTMFEECWCVILNKNSQEYVGYSSGLTLPPRVFKHLQEGGTHIDIMQQLESEKSISQKDTWALYSSNSVTRSESIQEAFRNALISLMVKV